MCTMCTQYLKKPEEDIESPETRITGGYELPSGCWEPNPDLQKELLVCAITKPLLQPPT